MFFLYKLLIHTKPIISAHYYIRVFLISTDINSKANLSTMMI